MAAALLITLPVSAYASNRFVGAIFGPSSESGWFF